MISYLDHAATAPVRPEVVEAMLPFLAEHFGNPSGLHSVGRAARQAIDDARDRVAAALGADAGDVIFTSGGTEADNLAMAAAGSATTGTEADAGAALICSAIEHHAVLRAVEARNGATVPVTADGLVDLDALDGMLGPSTQLVSVMTVNNEVGTVQPLHKVHRLIQRKAPQALLHTDAVQAVPWVDAARYTQFADLVSISAHKFGGPQGVGALIARNGTKVSPLFHGGGQERERRSGTQNVAGIVGMATAIDLTVAEREATVIRAAALRDRLVDGLLRSVPDSFETGDRASKVAGNAHLCFPGIESETLLVMLDERGVCASAGASCSSGAMEPSHVLLAMGLSPTVASSSLRLTLGRTTTDHEVDLALKVLPDVVAHLRETS